MRYENVRSKIKSGDVLAWTHRSWRTWYDIQIQLVRIFTQSEYSHVGVAYVVADRVFVLESVSSGIRQQPLSAEIPFFWLPTGSLWTDDTLVAAMSKMGQSYSKWEGILSLWRKIKPGSNDKWECAEYTNFILQNAGINIDCRNVPSEVVRWLQDNLEVPVYTVTKE
jgi:hypothetical protein